MSEKNPEKVSYKNVKGIRLVEKETTGKSGITFRFIGIFNGMVGSVPKYVVQVRDYADLLLLKLSILF